MKDVVDKMFEDWIKNQELEPTLREAFRAGFYHGSMYEHGEIEETLLKLGMINSTTECYKFYKKYKGD